MAGFAMLGTLEVVEEIRQLGFWNLLIRALSMYIYVYIYTCMYVCIHILYTVYHLQVQVYVNCCRILSINSKG